MKGPDEITNRMAVKGFRISLLLILLFWFLDIVTKFWAESILVYDRIFLGPFVILEYVQNRGSAFNLIEFSDPIYNQLFFLGADHNITIRKIKCRPVWAARWSHSYEVDYISRNNSIKQIP